MTFKLYSQRQLFLNGKGAVSWGLVRFFFFCSAAKKKERVFCGKKKKKKLKNKIYVMINYERHALVQRGCKFINQSLFLSRYKMRSLYQDGVRKTKTGHEIKEFKK
jgi:hypothetical protein